MAATLPVMLHGNPMNAARQLRRMPSAVRPRTVDA